MIKSYSKALAVSIPTARTGLEAHAQNRAGRMAGHHHRKYPGEFARGLFHPGGWRGVNRYGDGSLMATIGMSARAISSATSRGKILRLCGETLDRLGVA
jgi:hypothetical protein